MSNNKKSDELKQVAENLVEVKRIVKEAKEKEEALREEFIYRCTEAEVSSVTLDSGARVNLTSRENLSYDTGAVSQAVKDGEFSRTKFHYISERKISSTLVKSAVALDKVSMDELEPFVTRTNVPVVRVSA